MAILSSFASGLAVLACLALVKRSVRAFAATIARLIAASRRAAARGGGGAQAPTFERFRAELREPVAALAGRHPRLADLARSCPAALAAMAAPGEDEERIAAAARAMAQTIDGRPIAETLATLGVPLWLRKARPETFAAAPPRLPDGAQLRRRIAVYVPTGDAPPRCGGEDPAYWLSIVATAFETADEEIAIWAARCAARQNAEIWSHDLRATLMWAWHARRGADLARWTPSLGWARARVLTQGWLARSEFAIFGGPQDWALARDEVEGFLFTPLATPEDIAAEGEAMAHCVASYAREVATGDCALWSVRRGEERVATLELATACGSEFVTVRQLFGPSNAPAPRAAWRAATLFALARAQACESAPRPRATPQEAAARWRAFFEPYWAEKGGTRSWAPLEPRDGGLAFD